MSEEHSKLLLTVGNFAGSVMASSLVGFNVAMNQHMYGQKVKITPSVYFRSNLFYLRYIPAAVVGASTVSFYGTSPLLQHFTGMTEEAANVIALATIGPILSPLYARQEGGITLVSFRKMTQTDALAVLKKHAFLRVFVPGSLFTFLRNSVSLGTGGAIAADGGEAVARYVVSDELRKNHTSASKIVANGFVGVIAGAASSVFEFLRIAHVISASKDEKFSLKRHVKPLFAQRSYFFFLSLRSAQLGCFFACFIAGGELSKLYASEITSCYSSLRGCFS